MFLRWALVYVLSVLTAVLGGVVVWQNCALEGRCGAAVERQAIIATLRADVARATANAAETRRQIDALSAQVSGDIVTKTALLSEIADEQRQRRAAETELAETKARLDGVASAVQSNVSQIAQLQERLELVPPPQFTPPPIVTLAAPASRGAQLPSSADSAEPVAVPPVRKAAPRPLKTAAPVEPPRRQKQATESGVWPFFTN